MTQTNHNARPTAASDQKVEQVSLRKGEKSERRRDSSQKDRRTAGISAHSHLVLLKDAAIRQHGAEEAGFPDS